MRVPNTATTKRPGAGSSLSVTAALDRFHPRRAVNTDRRERERARYGFRVGGLGLMVAPATAAEVIDNARFSPIPRCPPWLSGVMNLRGLPVPVFDLRLALGLTAGRLPEQPTVLVIDSGGATVGIMIDDLPQPLRGLSQTGAPSALPARLAPFVTAVWVGADALWVEFDHRGFFSALSKADA